MFLNVFIMNNICIYLLNILFLNNFIKYLVYRYAIHNKYVQTHNIP